MLTKMNTLIFKKFYLKFFNFPNYKANISFSVIKPSLDKNEDSHNLIKKIRNIGIIAHVDAGKTTTTERMLYFSGFTKNIGNVDDGNTVMDYMDQERERGITINSSAISFYWKNYQFNLIDTPGHVDFSIEVERSLRILDSAIAIIDGSAGVEAQTLNVWRQSNKYNIPKIIYINKMDKSDANFDESLKSIETKLNTVALPLQMPIGKGKNYSGVIDLINMKKIKWKIPNDDGKCFEIHDLTNDDEYYKQAFEKRIMMIEKLAHLNEEFANILLDKYDMAYEKMNDNILLETYVRKSCLSSLLNPVFCGSSYKNIGIQSLMDATIKYLPSPLDLIKNNYKDFYDNNLFLVCFKIIHDHQKSRKKINPLTSIASLQTNALNIVNKAKNEESDNDILSFVRIYNGDLRTKTKLFNPVKNLSETIDKIYIPLSNQLKQVSQVSLGNIAIVTGLNNTSTGDILVSSKKVFDKAKEKLEKINNDKYSLMHANLNIVPPVYFCTVEPETEADEKRLNFALECLEREDPSLKVLFNVEENLGQTVIQGQGELHLDIIKNRIMKEYKLKVFFGPLNIAYKEMPTEEVKEMFNLEKKLGDKKNFVNIELTITPKKEHKFETVKLISSIESNFQNLPNDYLNSINHGIRSALNKGILLRYPLTNIDVYLNKLNSSHNVPLPYISSAAYICTMNALKKANCVIIQPIMNLEISTIKEFSPKVYNDLTRRNALNIIVNESNQTVNINAKVPLAKLSSYSSEIRKLTSGNSTFTINFNSYEQVTQREFQGLLENKKF